jgi:hypothetical protein
MTTQQLKSEPMKSNDPPHAYDDRWYEMGNALKSTMQVVEATSRNDDEDAVPSQPKDDVAIDIAVDVDTHRNVVGDPCDTSDMGRGGDVVTQDVANGIGNDERSYLEAESANLSRNIIRCYLFCLCINVFITYNNSPGWLYLLSSICLVCSICFMIYCSRSRVRRRSGVGGGGGGDNGGGG